MFIVEPTTSCGRPEQLNFGESDFAIKSTITLKNHQRFFSSFLLQIFMYILFQICYIVRMQIDVLDFETCFGQNIVQAANLVLPLWQPSFFMFYFLITFLAEVERLIFPLTMPCTFFAKTILINICYQFVIDANNRDRLNN